VCLLATKSDGFLGPNLNLNQKSAVSLPVWQTIYHHLCFMDKWCDNLDNEIKILNFNSKPFIFCKPMIRVSNETK